MGRATSKYNRQLQSKEMRLISSADAKFNSVELLHRNVLMKELEYIQSDENYRNPIIENWLRERIEFLTNGHN
jgi:hypothetical protein